MKTRRRASLTVEASLALPIFLYAMVLLSYLGLFIKCQDEVQWAMTRVVREASAEYGAGGSNALKSSLYYRTKLAVHMERAGLPVALSESKLLEDGENLDLIVRYRVTLPFRLGIPQIYRFRQRVHSRAFVGVEDRGRGTDAEDVTVYVAETGQVYHRKRECTYLKLSISQMKYGDIDSLRNVGGGRYKPCERCCEGKKLTSGAAVFITNFGDRYHSVRSCSGIKRTIREMKLSEVGSRTPCSKCGKRSD